jgi:hypothetical protein
MERIYRSNVRDLRKTLAMLGAVVAEVDSHLRYVWIDNPHPDFDARLVVGKRDDELISKVDAQQIMALKRETFALQSPISRVLSFERSDGVRYYSLSAYPIREMNETVTAILTVAFDQQPPAAKC